jgi:hypothetical protein
MSQTTTTPTADLIEGPIQASDIEKSAETKKKISPTLISPISITLAQGEHVCSEPPIL